MNIRVWLKAIRVPFFTATIIPVALGSIIGWHDSGNFMWMRFFLTIFGAMFIHAGTNLANDYFDHLSGSDEANLTPTPFSGGSRVIQERLIAPKRVLLASLLTFAVGSAIGIYLNYICGGNVILILGIIGVFLGFFYSANPFRIGYGGLGEVAVGVGFGPLMVMGAYYVQTGVLPFRLFLASIPAGMLIALVLFVNEFPDYLSDKAVGKRTWVVLLSRKRAVFLYHILLVLTYAVVLFLIIFKIIPLICFIALLSLPLAIKAFVVSKNNFERVYELLPANASTIALHSIVGVLLCLGFVLDKVFFLH